MQRPPFPAAIDNTIRSTFKACKRKGLYRILLARQSPFPSIHLHAGGAFAKGLETARRAYYLGGESPEDSVALGWQALHEEYGDFEPAKPMPNKSAHRMGEALVSYFDEYPLPTDHIRPAMFNGQPAVEFNFAIPLPITHPETGDPLIYCGRFDMLGESNGQLFVVDEKTTGSLGEYWSRRYELSAQFTGYCWGAMQYGYPVVGAIVRGIGILSKEIKHAALPFLRPQFMIDEWYRQMLRDVSEMRQAYLDTNWDKIEAPDGLFDDPYEQFGPDFNDTCGSYGGCDYIPVCGVAPFARHQMLQINFAQRNWEPLKGGLVDE